MRAVLPSSHDINIHNVNFNSLGHIPNVRQMQLKYVLLMQPCCLKYMVSSVVVLYQG